MKQSGKFLIGLFGILFTAMFIYFFYSNNQLRESRLVLETEKEELSQELNTTVTKLDAKIAEGESYKVKLSAARKDLYTYRDSLEIKKKETNQLVYTYKTKVSVLEKEKEEIAQKMTELSSENVTLNQKVSQFQQTLKQKEIENKALGEKLLSKKENSSLKVSELNFIAQTKLKGQYVKTDRYKKTEVFKIAFKIDGKISPNEATKFLYFVIKDPKGNVVSVQGKTASGLVYSHKMNAFEGVAKTPSAAKTISTSIQKDVDFVMDVHSKIIKGKYVLTMLLDGEEVATSKLALDDGV